MKMNTGATKSTLFESLSQIPDHRTKKGQRFPLVAILTITLAAMLSGVNDLRAVFRWRRRFTPKACRPERHCQVPHSDQKVKFLLEHNDRLHDKGHGRIETRMIAVRTQFPLSVKEKWHDISAVSTPD